MQDMSHRAMRETRGRARPVDGTQKTVHVTVLGGARGVVLDALTRGNLTTMLCGRWGDGARTEYIWTVRTRLTLSCVQRIVDSVVGWNKVRQSKG